MLPPVSEGPAGPRLLSHTGLPPVAWPRCPRRDALVSGLSRNLPESESPRAALGEGCPVWGFSCPLGVGLLLAQRWGLGAAPR